MVHLDRSASMNVHHLERGIGQLHGSHASPAAYSRLRASLSSRFLKSNRGVVSKNTISQ